MKMPVVLLYNILDDPKQQEEQYRDINIIDSSLEEFGYSVNKVAVGVDTSKLMLQLKEISPKYIFNLCEEVNNNSWGEIYIAGLMELIKIPYTGSSPACLSLALNKARTKDVLLNQDVIVPRYQVFDSEHVILKDDLHFPLIIKPLCEDGSFGIELNSVVNNKEELYERIKNRLKEFNGPVIAEEYIEGRELNISILENDRGPWALPVSELDYSTMPEGYPKICSYSGKWDKDSVDYKGTVPVCPANISKELHNKLEEIAIKVYKIMGCSDYARVDVRLDKNETPYVIDVNPNPCISPDSGFVRSSEAYGIDYKNLINAIMKNCERRNRNGKHSLDPAVTTER